MSFTEALAQVLSELTLVPSLLLLLSSPNLSPSDQLAVVLTLGRCTDACGERLPSFCYLFYDTKKKNKYSFFLSCLCVEEHQSELLQSGGLPLIISLLTDVNDEEVKKAATFVLQTCKKLSELFSYSRDIHLDSYSPNHCLFFALSLSSWIYGMSKCGV